MTQPSKLMCQLGSLSRGLDKENPEFEPKSRYKLALKLRKIGENARKLEEDEFNGFFIINSARDATLDLLESVNVKSKEDIKQSLVELMEILEGVE
ncbi:hypothetical protein [Acinetobacter sp. NyZ410]|uniref:hypothetical protein n=1 Tax=Acinetobacter sp. NyZ410 TaxID=2929509 RepID=UPI001FBB6BD8|nr:hypothetical protein [Acinetobacter sp. NyZ410]UOH16938.1 hypothetical protein MTO68_13990 [Acinetobacter sp. NyZ410]